VQIHKSKLCSCNITGAAAAAAAATEDSNSSNITGATASHVSSSSSTASPDQILINPCHANIQDCRENTPTATTLQNGNPVGKKG